MCVYWGGWGGCLKLVTSFFEKLEAIRPAESGRGLGVGGFLCALFFGGLHLRRSGAGSPSGHQGPRLGHTGLRPSSGSRRSVGGAMAGPSSVVSHLEKNTFEINWGALDLLQEGSRWASSPRPTLRLPGPGAGPRRRRASGAPGWRSVCQAVLRLPTWPLARGAPGPFSAGGQAGTPGCGLNRTLRERGRAFPS